MLINYHKSMIFIIIILCILCIFLLYILHITIDNNVNLQYITKYFHRSMITLLPYYNPPYTYIHHNTHNNHNQYINQIKDILHETNTNEIQIVVYGHYENVFHEIIHTYYYHMIDHNITCNIVKYKDMNIYNTMYNQYIFYILFDSHAFNNQMNNETAFKYSKNYAVFNWVCTLYYHCSNTIHHYVIHI